MFVLTRAVERGEVGGQVTPGPHLEKGPRNSHSHFFNIFFSFEDCRRRKGPTKRDALECSGPHKAQGALGSVRPQTVWGSRMRVAPESKGPESAGLRKA